MASEQMLAKLAELKAARLARESSCFIPAEETKKEVPAEDRTCRSCYYLLGKRIDLETAATKWRCYHENNRRVAPKDMVTGELTVEYLTHDIYEVRNTVCCGNWYAEYIPPSYEQPTATPAPMRSSTARNKISLDDI
jgi:hypothetical protein